MRTSPKRRDWSWRSLAFRGLLVQVIAILLVALLAWFLAGNAVENMRARGIRSGFDFLTQPAGFEIGESILNYNASQSYGKAFLVGLANTVRVALVGIILATLIGILIGVGRLSRNFLARKLCAVYVETFRNIPLLIQLLMWYFMLTTLLPPATDALQPVKGIFLSQSGLQFPLPVQGPAEFYVAIGLMLGVAAAWWVRKAASRRRGKTGQARSALGPGLALIVAGPIAGWLGAGAPTQMEFPELGTFNISGGGALTPEYLTMVIGLTLYTAAFLAEIVRGGIVSVPAGQSEAAASLGLDRTQMMRLIVLPQALRVIIPPTTSQYLNLIKNSSLAVAVGYPDLVSISNTTLNQTGRSLECITIIMAIYLSLSLLTAALMNWYNRYAAIPER